MTGRPAPGRAAPHRGAGPSDGVLLGLLAALVGSCLAVDLAANVGGLLDHGRWPHVGLAEATGLLAGLLRHPADPYAGLTAAQRAGLPGAGLFYTLLAVVLLAGLAVGLGVLRVARTRRSNAGWASRADIRRQLSAAAVRAKARLIRPSIRARRPPLTEIAIHLGRDVHTRQQLYGSLEDSYAIVGPPRSGKGVHLVIPITLEAPGAAVVPSTKPDTLAAAIRARARQGPVHVFDPQNLTDWPDRLRWAPQLGCADPLTAILRANAFAAGAKLAHGGVSHGDFWAAMTQAVLRCYLHAADLDGRTIRDVLRWAANPTDPEPVRILHRRTGAADGWADELDEQAAADPRQRGSVWAGVRRALDSLADPRVLDACTPRRQDAFDTEAFLAARSTLYLLGSTGAQLSVAPLITALIEDLVEGARRSAAHSPGGRLDPPLLLILDEAANIAPLPSLPSLLADGGGIGIPTIAVLQSLAQARARWGDAATDAIWDAATIKIILGGLAKARDLSDIAGLAGDVDEPVATVSHGPGGASTSTATRRTPALPARDLRNLPFGRAVLLHRTTPPMQAQLPSTMRAT